VNGSTKIREARDAQTENLVDHVFYRSQRKRLPLIDRGEGIYFYDMDGKRYIDGSSGALVSNIGHSMVPIVEAMRRQAEKIEFVHGTMFKSEPAIKLAHDLIEMCPGSLDKVYFVSGGSEACETALKMARSYHVGRGNGQKYIVISRWQSYHGATIGALSMTGRTSLRKIYQPLLLDFPHIPPAYCYRCPYGKEQEACSSECAWELERTIKQVGAEYISAFMAEPIVGATLGAVSAPPEYFSIVRQICDRYDVLFIADEVMTGFGRTGKNFGIEHWEVTPDIIVGGKGLGAGYFPIGVAICTDKVFQPFQETLGSFTHGFTYQGNPLAAAVALSVVDFIKENDLVAHVARMGEYLMERLSGMYRFDFVGDVRGRGFMTAVELVKDKGTKEPFPREREITRLVTETAWKRGLILYPASGGQVQGVAGDAFMVAPPFIATQEQLDEIIDILDQMLEEVHKEIRADY
jgi:adenosylmethionine-8-amino-7-oxononanoate aminotransferase